MKPFLNQLATKGGRNYALNQKAKAFEGVKDASITPRAPLAQDSLNQSMLLTKSPEVARMLDEYDEEPPTEFENLLGKTKTGTMQKFKVDSDKAILDSLFAKTQVLDKSKTKGRFHVEVRTSAVHWIVDKEWQRKANPIARNAEDRMLDLDKKILNKRRHQRILKNTAMEQQYKIVVKK